MKFSITTDHNGLIVAYPPSTTNDGYTETEVNHFMSMKHPHLIDGEVVEPADGQFYINGSWVDKSGYRPDFKGGFISETFTQVMSWNQPSTANTEEIPLSTSDINGASTRMTTTFAAMPDAEQAYTFSNGTTINFNKTDWDDLVQKVHALLSP